MSIWLEYYIIYYQINFVNIPNQVAWLQFDLDKQKSEWESC